MILKFEVSANISKKAPKLTRNGAQTPQKLLPAFRLRFWQLWGTILAQFWQPSSVPEGLQNEPQIAPKSALEYKGHILCHLVPFWRRFGAILGTCWGSMFLNLLA